MTAEIETLTHHVRINHFTTPKPAARPVAKHAVSK
jgi:hypothetical protein